MQTNLFADLFCFSDFGRPFFSEQLVTEHRVVVDDVGSNAARHTFFDSMILQMVYLPNFAV